MCNCQFLRYGHVGGGFGRSIWNQILEFIEHNSTLYPSPWFRFCCNLFQSVLCALGWPTLGCILYPGVERITEFYTKVGEPDPLQEK